MFRGLLNNLPDVTKNLLILNVLFFLAKVVLANQGVDLGMLLGLHYPASELFAPYQIATHFFMHGDIMHLLFNMFGLVFLGVHLERMWGAKRFLIFYFVTAIGAAFLYTFVQGIEVYHSTGEFFPHIDLIQVDERSFTWEPNLEMYRTAAGIYRTDCVGASGAIYGLIMAYAVLFPNTQFMLLFPPIPIKAKWLATALAAFALYGGYARAEGDSVAHFAHLGGMLFAFILIKIWQRDKSSFY